MAWEPDLASTVSVAATAEAVVDAIPDAATRQDAPMRAPVWEVASAAVDCSAVVLADAWAESDVTVAATAVAMPDVTRASVVALEAAEWDYSAAAWPAVWQPVRDAVVAILPVAVAPAAAVQVAAALASWAVELWAEQVSAEQVWVAAACLATAPVSTDPAERVPASLWLVAKLDVESVDVALADACATPAADDWALAPVASVVCSHRAILTALSRTPLRSTLMATTEAWVEWAARELPEPVVGCQPTDILTIPTVALGTS